MTFATSEEKPFGIIRTDQRGRLLIRAGQREAILAALDQSTLSVMAFCRQHGLCYSTVAHWNQKRRRANGAAPSPPATQSPFVEVLVKSEAAAIAQPHGPLRLTLPSGATVEISDSTQIPLLAELLRVLSPARPC
jgi:hypothetical protein